MIKGIASLGFLLNNITNPANSKTRPMTHKEQLLVKELELRELRQRNAEIESQFGILEAQTNTYARMQRESERLESSAMDELERVRMDYRALERESIETRKDLERRLDGEEMRHLTNLNSALMYLDTVLAGPTDEQLVEAKEFAVVGREKLKRIGLDKP